jgi:hypothetical protein
MTDCHHCPLRARNRWGARRNKGRFLDCDMRRKGQWCDKATLFSTAEAGACPDLSLRAYALREANSSWRKWARCKARVPRPVPLPQPLNERPARVRRSTPGGRVSAASRGDAVPAGACTSLNATLKSEERTMTKRGPRPKPARLRLIEGTHRPARHGPRENSGATSCGATVSPADTLRKPSSLSPEASTAWDRFIVPAIWLDRFRGPAAVAFCELWVEFITHPAAFQAARHAQLRAYMGDLGLTDERNRREPEKPADPADSTSEVASCLRPLLRDPGRLGSCVRCRAACGGAPDPKWAPDLRCRPQLWRTFARARAAPVRALAAAFGRPASPAAKRWSRAHV